MCVILFSYKQHSDYPLILAANRDEYYDRPTAAADYWKDFPSIYAGRDLVSEGTWLGVAQPGRFAAVTNYRDMSQDRGTRSRGDLVADFLKSDLAVADYMDRIAKRKTEYTGFNLLAGEINPSAQELFYYSNKIEHPRKLVPGIYGLSNHLLDTPWPKIVKGKRAFAEITDHARVKKESLFELLHDRQIARDEELPDTGIGLETERLLSAIFIEAPIYGTRCSSVLTIDADFRAELEEKVFV